MAVLRDPEADCNACDCFCRVYGLPVDTGSDTKERTSTEQVISSHTDGIVTVPFCSNFDLHNEYDLQSVYLFPVLEY